MFHMIQDAIDRFFGRGRYRKRVNCAQAVAGGFAGRFPMAADETVGYRRAGRGRAPGRVCGAYYAADRMLTEHRPEDRTALADRFRDEAGSVICRDIRRRRHLDCGGCVRLAAEFLNELPEETKSC